MQRVPRAPAAALRPLTVFLALSAAALAACSSGRSNSQNPQTGNVQGTLRVLAASTLTNAFNTLGPEFEAQHPGTKIRLSFGSSSDLRNQILQGAPSDVFVSADIANMDALVAKGGAATTPVVVAKNKVAIAVESGNPKGISTLADLDQADVTVVLCAASVPCGRLADEVLDNAGVQLTARSRELSVRAALTKVELGEADAALVYASDVASSDKVEGILIPDSVNVSTSLPAVVLSEARNVSLARAWIDFVIAHRDRLINNFGFIAP